MKLLQDYFRAAQKQLEQDRYTLAEKEKDLELLKKPFNFIMKKAETTLKADIVEAEEAGKSSKSQKELHKWLLQAA